MLQLPVVELTTDQRRIPVFLEFQEFFRRTDWVHFQYIFTVGPCLRQLLVKIPFLFILPMMTHANILRNTNIKPNLTLICIRRSSRLATSSLNNDVTLKLCTVLKF